MRYPTHRANAVNSAAVTIAARLRELLAGAASAGILASILSTSTVAAEVARPSPASATGDSGSSLTPIQDNSAPQHRGALPSAQLASSEDLDGLHLWLGPWGARTEAPTGVDSCVGLELAATRIREREAVGAVGLVVGAARYASSDGGRLTASALVGTRRGTGWMVGASAGPIVELSPLSRVKLGASAGIWVFAGVTPFARVATVEGRGVFAELGVSVALPVLRWAK